MRKRGFFMVVLALLLLCAPTLSAQEPLVSMTVSEYSELCQIVDRSETRLNQLEAQLSVQLETSKTQTEESEKVLSELNESRSLLKESRNELAKASVSLTKARETISELERSLQALEDEMASLTHKMNLAKRQRNLWAGIAIASIGYGIAKTID